MSPLSYSTPRVSGLGIHVIAAVAVLVCAASILVQPVEPAQAAAAVPAATLRDPANDVRAGDIDLTSISVSKRDGALVVRFTVRRPITDDVSYTASVKAGAGSWALVARRSAETRLFPALQPHDRDDNDRFGCDRRPYGDDQSSNRGPWWAVERDARPGTRPTSAPSRWEAGAAAPTAPRPPDRRSGSVSPIAARGRNGVPASGPARFAESERDGGVPSWSPAGEVAFARENGCGIDVAREDGTKRRRLTRAC